MLTYADLHTIGGPLDKRGLGREIELHLTGNMEHYMWATGRYGSKSAGEGI